LTAALGLFPAATYGQDCVHCSVSADPDPPVPTGLWLLTKQVTEVDLLFLAMERGQPVGGLSQADLLIEDDTKPPVSVVAFRTEPDLPLRLGIVIDTSNSVTERFKFEQDAASAFLREIVHEHDAAFVMGFSDHPRLAQDFTGDPDVLSKGIARLNIGGGTAIYDAVRTGCQKLLYHSELDIVGRVLVVLSDGQNNAGRSTLAGAIEAAQESGVTIYTISTNYSEDRTHGFSAEAGNRNLQKLAEQTGGRMFMPAAPREVSKSFGKISLELRSRYDVSYKPADFTPDGHYRKIKIEVKKGGRKVEIRARKGYYARAISVFRTDPPQEPLSFDAPNR
jgi:VWFA-related protein